LNEQLKGKMLPIRKMANSERQDSKAFAITTTEDPKQEILLTWQTPAPGENPAKVRPKTFAKVRLVGGQLAFRKMDSRPEFTQHEAAIITTLKRVECVPALICCSKTSIYMHYVDGQSLPDAIINMRPRVCFDVAWQILAAIAVVHAKGVIHGDVRPWNFIYGPKGRLYLVDFEYAYLRDAIRQPGLLKVHHTLGLRPPLSDWTDAFQSVADLWRSSPHPIMSRGLFLAPASLSWALRMTLAPRQYFLRGRRFFSTRLSRLTIRPS
jgi:serine/threonine protein kinase